MAGYGHKNGKPQEKENGIGNNERRQKSGKVLDTNIPEERLDRKRAYIVKLGENF